jgi:precorrin-2 dehydrogenase/sirohydrochlorin ferrochelatase
MSETEADVPKYYPVCLDIAGKQCLVVGGGKVALRKALDLLEAGAKVRAVAPQFIEAFRKSCGIELCRKAYDSADLRDCALVIAATDSEDVNRRVCEDARLARVLVNVVDAPELCDFIVPATLRRGDMTISVSTGGASPSLARKIRLELEKRYPARFAAFVGFLGKMRREARKKFPASRRRQIMERILNGHAWEVFAKKGARAAKRFIEGQMPKAKGRK